MSEMNTTSNLQSMHVFVTGKVQGVYYRKSTQEQALRIGLEGWVRNLTDGRVECRALGCESDLLRLLSWMGKGPERARIERVDVQWGGTEDRDWLVEKGTFVVEKTV